MTSVTAGQGHIPWGRVELLLLASRSVWLATTRPDGRPYAVPVRFVWQDDHLYVVAHRDQRTGVDLRREPQVVFHLGDGDDVVIVEGRAEVVTDSTEVARVEESCSRKYLDQRGVAETTARHEGEDLYRVAVRQVAAWQHGDIGTRTDWRFGVTGRAVPGEASGE